MRHLTVAISTVFRLFAGCTRAHDGDLGPPFAIDPTFGDRGVTTIDFATAFAIAWALLVQRGMAMSARFAAGLLSAMFLIMPSGPAWAHDGELDPTFANDGRLVLAPGDSSLEATTIAVLPDGAFVVAGRRLAIVDNQPKYWIGIWRFLADGAPDTNFGDGGVAYHELRYGSATASAMLIQPDGKIVLAYYFDYPETDQYFRMIRFTSEGNFDYGFGLMGDLRISFYDLGYSIAYAYALALDADGRIVVGGTCADEARNSVMAFTRIEPDGSGDPGFGDGGRSIVSFSEPDYQLNAGAGSLAVASDGSITAAGSAVPNFLSLPPTIAVARLRADGSLDADFAYGGKAQFVPPNSNSATGQTIFALDSGMVLVAGVCYPNSGPEEFCATRLDSNGHIDASYGDGGWGLIPISGELRRNEARAVVQADGKLVIAGASPDEPPADFVAGRLTAEGQPDPSFGDSGISTVSFSDGGDEGAAAIALQAGRPILVGFTDGGVPGPWGVAAARLQNDALFHSGFD